MLHLGQLTNIRLGWKGLPGTNALAYHEKAQLTAVKSFITMATGEGVWLFSVLIKFLMFVASAKSVIC